MEEIVEWWKVVQTKPDSIEAIIISSNCRKVTFFLSHDAKHFLLWNSTIIYQI